MHVKQSHKVGKTEMIFEVILLKYLSSETSQYVTNVSVCICIYLSVYVSVCLSDCFSLRLVSRDACLRQILMAGFINPCKSASVGSSSECYK